MKTISANDYLVLKGLALLYQKYSKAQDEAASVAEEITGEAAHTCDMLSGWRDMDEGLALLGIEVVHAKQENVKAPDGATPAGQMKKDKP